MNRWKLSKHVENRAHTLIDDYLRMLNRLTPEEVELIDAEKVTLDLFNSGLSPFTLKVLLEKEFGFSLLDETTNGWQYDITIEFLNPNSNKEIFSKLTLQGCGQTYELTLCPKDFV